MSNQVKNDGRYVANIGLWTLQILTAAAFLLAGVAKLIGQPMMVETFEKVGVGHWFRYVTGAIEVASAILLVIRRLSPIGAALLVCTMIGAVLEHMLVLHGSAAPALVLGCFAGIILWGRRATVKAWFAFARAKCATEDPQRVLSPIGKDYRRFNKANTILTLLLLTTPIAMQAFERGKVERFATLPAGEAHPEGITVDRDGNVYVVTVAVNKPETSQGTLIVFDPNGKHLRTVSIVGSSRMLLDVRFHPQTGQLLVIDYEGGKVLAVDPTTGASSVFMTVTGEDPGLDGLTFDAAGNVYVTGAHQGIIWRVGKDGGAAAAWIKSPLLKPTRLLPPIGANGLEFNKKQTTLFVANTAQDTIVKVPVSGSPLEPGTPEVFANRAGGGPDGLIIDEHDNLWIACNQSNEIIVIEPTEGRVIAKLGDFGGIDKDDAPIGFLWSNSLVFHGEDVLVTNLSLDARIRSQTLRTVDGPWAAQVKLHTVSKIRKQIPRIPQ